MTNAELIAELQKYPSDIQVVFTWEGIIRRTRPHYIYMSKDGRLVLDADENTYKERFVSGERSTEDHGVYWEDDEDNRPASFSTHVMFTPERTGIHFVTTNAFGAISVGGSSGAGTTGVIDTPSKTT
jgi:hypothetical protein